MSNNSSTEYRTDLRLGQSPYLFISSIVCNFLDLIHRMVFDFYFDGVTVKTGNCVTMVAARSNIVYCVTVGGLQLYYR